MTDTLTPAPFAPSRTDLLDMERPTSVIPFVDRILASIEASRTCTALDAVASSDAVSQLAPADLETVVAYGKTRRAAILAESAIVVSSTPVATGPAITGPYVRGSSEAQAIGDIVASANEETIRARRAARRPLAGNDAASIATAVSARRASVTELLANGSAMALDVGSGKLGCVIHYGKRRAEVDPVTLRDRQALIRWADVQSALTGAGFPVDFLGESCTRKRHLGEAVKVINNQGRIARSADRLDGTKAVWVVGSIDSDSTTASMGPKDCVITLTVNDEIVVSRECDESAEILADYTRRVDEDRISATELLRRIDMALEDMGTRDCDFGLYVAPGLAEKAVKLCRALQPIAGRRFYTMGVGSSSDVAEGLAAGFEADIAKLENEVTAKLSDLRKLSGASFVARCETLKQSALGLRALLGDETGNAFLARLATVDALITTALDDTAQRYANLELS